MPNKKELTRIFLSPFNEGVEFPSLLNVEKAFFYEVLKAMNTPRDLEVEFPRSQVLDLLSIDKDDPNSTEIILKTLSRFQSIKISFFRDDADFIRFVLFPSITLDDKKMCFKIEDSFYSFLKKFKMASSLSLLDNHFSDFMGSGDEFFDPIGIAISCNGGEEKALNPSSLTS